MGLLEEPKAQIVFLSKILQCECCGCSGAKRRRQNTAYVNKESNYATLCDSCQKEADAYWEERWQEYYSGRL